MVSAHKCVKKACPTYFHIAENNEKEGAKKGRAGVDRWSKRDKEIGNGLPK